MIEIKNLHGQVLLSLSDGKILNSAAQTIGMTNGKNLLNLAGQVLAAVEGGNSEAIPRIWPDFPKDQGNAQGSKKATANRVHQQQHRWLFQLFQVSVQPYEKRVTEHTVTINEG